MSLALQLFFAAGLLNAQSTTVEQQAARINQLLKAGDPDVIGLLRKMEAYAKQPNHQRALAQCYDLFGIYYTDNGHYSKAQHYFFQALKRYEDDHVWNRAASVRNNIGNLFFKMGHYERALVYYEKALRFYEKSANRYNYAHTCSNIGANYHQAGDDKTALIYYTKGLRIVDSLNDPANYTNLLLNKGSSLQDLAQADSAEYYFYKVLPYYERTHNAEGLAKTYANLGLNSEQAGDLKRAQQFYHRSLAIAQKADRTADQIAPLEGLLLTHNLLHQPDSVDFYYFALMTEKDELSRQKTDKNIAEIEAKYQVAKTREQLAEARSQKIAADLANRNIALLSVIIFVLLVLLVGTTWFFQYRKTNQRLRRQEAEIDRLLRTQESLAFQSQLEGEAQERKRIAQELHDRVGGLLATVNLHFEALTEKKERFEDGIRIQELIKTSINEVRTISHNLQGIGEGTDLELALRQLQSGITSTGKLDMQLFYELGAERLSNHLVNEIYKIIQELLANTLRHAKAQTVTVQLSAIDEGLQLIFEDDGSGFDPQSVRRGLGLNSIAQRIEQAGGTLSIDSRPGKGTIIIVQIPLHA